MDHQAIIDAITDQFQGAQVFIGVWSVRAIYTRDWGDDVIITLPSALKDDPLESIDAMHELADERLIPLLNEVTGESYGVMVTKPDGIVLKNENSNHEDQWCECCNVPFPCFEWYHDPKNKGSISSQAASPLC